MNKIIQDKEGVILICEKVSRNLHRKVLNKY